MKWRHIVSSSYRNVFALGLVSFFTDVSSEMVFSLLPAFILGLPGSSRATLGLIEGVAEALSYGMRAVSGVFSDVFQKRKVIVFIGYALSNVVKPFFAVVQTVHDALILRVTERVGKAVRTAPRDALLSESVPHNRRGLAFGLHRTLDQTGAIVGPIIASTALLVFGLSIGDIFILSLLPGSIALVILLLFVHEYRGQLTRERFPLLDLKAVLTGPFIRLLGLVAIFSIGAYNFSFILVNAKEAGVSNAYLPLVYAVVNVTHTVIAIPIGFVADRIGKEHSLLIGYCNFLGTTISILLLPHTVTTAFIVALAYGIYSGIVETVQRALVPEYANDALRGTAYGVYYLVVGSAFFVANIIVGMLWEFRGPMIALLYSLTASSIAILGMVVLVRLKTTAS